MMKRHSIHRAVAAVLLAGSAAVGVLGITGSAQAVTPADWGSGYGYGSTYGYGNAVQGLVVAPIPLNVRSGPGTGYPLVGSLANGTTISLTGKSAGTDVFGNNRWFELADGQGWVSAHYVDNYGYVPWVNY